MPAETGIARHIMAAYTSPSRGYVSYAIVQHPRGLKIPPAAAAGGAALRVRHRAAKVGLQGVNRANRTDTPLYRLRFIPIGSTFHSAPLRFIPGGSGN